MPLESVNCLLALHGYPGTEICKTWFCEPVRWKVRLMLGAAVSWQECGKHLKVTTREKCTASRPLSLADGRVPSWRANSP